MIITAMEPMNIDESLSVGLPQFGLRLSVLVEQ